ncbi:trichohyalin-like isoform X2 [Xenia sp. Carnegie-2017]|nr:trichohyalin-like isoform X2 [Xenia sp. Carnegie-2017]
MAAKVEYKFESPPTGRKPPLGKPGVPYANPLEIQQRQEQLRIERERQEQLRIERERQQQLKIERERQEQLTIEKERQEKQRIERERQEKQRIERERQDQQRIERERQEQQKIERERQDQQRIERERQEKQRIEWERQEQQRIERERREQERLRMLEEKQEREKIERNRQDRMRIEREQERARIERENEQAHEQSKMSELDEMTRRERELELLLEEKRREKARRLQELQRQIQEEEERALKEEQELRERLKKEREERKEPQKTQRPSDVGTTKMNRYQDDSTSRVMNRPIDVEPSQRNPRPSNTQVHYVLLNDDNSTQRSNRLPRAPTPAEVKRVGSQPAYGKIPTSPIMDGRSSDVRVGRPGDNNKGGPMTAEDNKSTSSSSKRSFPPNQKRFSPQNSQDDSLDIDPAEIERQFQERLAKEANSKNGTDSVDGGMVRVIRVPVQQENWEKPVDDKPRARVDWQRSEEEKNRREQQWRREADEQLVRDFQQNESFRQSVSTVAEPVHVNPVDREKEEELRRQREEDDRLREARANQLRNRIIEGPDDDGLDSSYTNGRTRRVKFASVRTEIVQPSPDAELATSGVKFVHDGKVEDSDDDGSEEFPLPPPPADKDNNFSPLPQNQVDYYQRPPPPPKPQFLVNNGSGPPAEYKGAPNSTVYRDNGHVARARDRMSDNGYATYPGPARLQNNNIHPVPKPRSLSNDMGKSPNPETSFKDKVKMLNENLAIKRPDGSQMAQNWINRDSL